MSVEEKLALSVVVPIRGRHEDIPILVAVLAGEARRSGTHIELVLVSELSEASEISRSLATSRQRSDLARVTYVSTRKALGQHPASVVGILHSGGELVAVIDSDDVDVVPVLLARARLFNSDTLDFEMYQPHNPSGHLLRRVGSRITEFLGRIRTGAPKGFRFSSKLLLSRQFVESIRHDLVRLDDMQSGWMFNFSGLYEGVPYVSPSQHKLQKSTYRLGTLFLETAQLARRALQKHLTVMALVSVFCLAGIAALQVVLAELTFGEGPGSQVFFVLFHLLGATVVLVAVWAGASSTVEAENVAYKALVHSVTSDRGGT